MTRRIIFTIMFMAIMSGALHGAQSGVNPEPGVGRELARWRATHYGNVRYALTLEVAPGASLMKGQEEIRVVLDDAAGDVVLDWRVAAARDGQPQSRVWEIKANGRAVADARQINDHLIIPSAYLVKGENVLSLRFESPIATSGSAVTRYVDREDNSEYLYTLFVPSDASTAFPCFDQPDLKARFQLEMTAPASWKVISNTLEEEIKIFEGRNTKQTRFGQTQPISTYLFAFAAGPFEEFEETAFLPPGKRTAYPPVKTTEEALRLVQNARRNAEPAMRVFARQSKAERARKELPEVFRLNREGLAYLAKYFDYKFPFPKYDLVILPEFAYRGMEHAGATFLREESILFPSDPTAGDYLARADIMFHEAAHQWFGDLVTMRWFDDLWLKEGFAEFMAHKAIEAVMPQYNAWKFFYQRTKPLAYLTDATKGTTPIFQEIPNLSAAKSAYGNIVYRKAPSILRQAEFYLGPEKFRAAVGMFLKEHAYANAEWANLVRDFERTSGNKLDAWAANWVTRRGMPEIRVRLSEDQRGRIASFALEQRDVLAEGGSWPMRVRVLLAYKQGPPQILTVTMKGAGTTAVAELTGKLTPAYVFANYEDYGYGLFLLDEKSMATVLEGLGAVRDDFLRALLWGSLWDSVREAELAPSSYIDLAVKRVAEERDEVTVQSILGRVRTAFNYYLSDAQRREMAVSLEQELMDRMMNAETAGLRITYFRAFQAIAMTEGARSRLKKILSGEAQIPGMTLRSRDRFDIATALMARGDAEAASLLDKLSREDQTDDARRYAYAAGAARADEAAKKRYFDAYLNDTKLAESWIEASLPAFNTIHQAELTLPYLEPALKELPTLKRTRKIFFVNGWLSAFVGGQCSETALRTVRNFLESEKSLDRDLRLKVLEVLDDLERCVRIKARYASSSRN
ncbi:MAG TPA: M1 family aminopeptidase [Pyrinomonadaceae bacterium]|jgi:aminopeptidase N